MSRSSQVNSLLATIQARDAEVVSSDALQELIVSHVIADGSPDVTMGLLQAYWAALTQEETDVPGAKGTVQAYDYLRTAYVDGFRAIMPDQDEDRIIQGLDWPDGLPDESALVYPLSLLADIGFVLGAEAARDTKALYQARRET